LKPNQGIGGRGVGRRGGHKGVPSCKDELVGERKGRNAESGERVRTTGDSAEVLVGSGESRILREFA